MDQNFISLYKQNRSVARGIKQCTFVNFLKLWRAVQPSMPSTYSLTFSHVPWFHETVESTMPLGVSLTLQQLYLLREAEKAAESAVSLASSERTREQLLCTHGSLNVRSISKKKF